MKKYCLLVLVLIGLSVYAQNILVASSDQSRDITVSGVVKEGSGKKTIENVSLMVNGTDIGTVSNAEGKFSLTFPDSLLSRGIRAEHIGFKGRVMKGNELLSGTSVQAPAYFQGA